ncbi:MAG: hypothetical protein WAL83_10535 [Arenicellales bacterium]
MKRLIIATVVIACAAAAAVYLSHRSRATNNLASGVPATTLFYVDSGGGSQWWDNLRKLGVSKPSDKQMAALREGLSSYGPAGRMIYGLYATYSERLAAKRQPVPGLGERPRMVAYTIGLAPTVHLVLRDPAAFQAFIDEAEKRGEVQPEGGSYQSTSFRSYPLLIDGKPGRAALIVAVRDKLGVITLDVEEFRDRVLPLALGLQTPDDSLADSGILERAAETHDLKGDTVSFFNHRAVVNALTGPEDDLAARMLKTALGDSAPELEPLRTPACRTDMAAIADIMPMTVFGWADDTAADGAQHMKAVTEIHDPPLVQSLQRLRGHLPEFLQRPATRPVLSMALALDMSAPPSVVTDLWQRFTDASFQCPWLLEAQQRARRWNPAAVTMGTMMLSSIRGLSFSVYDLKAPKGGGFEVQAADALATISTRDPRPLIALAQTFLPALANVEFPGDGSPVALPIPTGTADPLMASVTGSHIALFMGAQSGEAAATLKNEGLDANGLFFIALDYHRLAPILLAQVQNAASVAAAQGAGSAATGPAAIEEFKDAVRRMADITMPVSETVDIEDQGLVLDATLAPAE